MTEFDGLGFSAMKQQVRCQDSLTLDCSSSVHYFGMFSAIFKNKYAFTIICLHHHHIILKKKEFISIADFGSTAV